MHQLYKENYEIMRKTNVKCRMSPEHNAFQSSMSVCFISYEFSISLIENPKLN